MGWPGWDTIETADWWSNFWFWFGIGCLAALGVTEVISHLYGLRRDELIATRARDAEAQRKNNEDNHNAEVGRLRKQLDDANKEVTELKKFQAQRHLTNDQKKTIIAAISPFPGQIITISSVLGDEETKVYRDDFVPLFEAAKWDHKGDHGILETNYDVDPVGIELVVHKVNERQGLATDAVVALEKVIGDLGLFDSGGPRKSPEIPSGEVQLRVGHKPRQ